MATGRYLMHLFASRGFLRHPSSSVNQRLLKLWAPLFGSPIRVIMPALSPTMTDGTIIKWHKKEGDSVKAGDVLCDIQTDKAVISMETEEEGVLAKILKPDNTSGVKIGTLIAVMAERGDNWQTIEIPSDAAAESAASDNKPAASSTSHAEDSSHGPAHGFGPAVRSLLDTYGLHAKDVKPSGPHSTLLKGDVLQYIKAKNLKPAASSAHRESTETKAAASGTSSRTSSASSAPPPPPPAKPGVAYTDIPLTNIRSIIARRLLESKVTIPHSYTSVDCHMDALLNLRRSLSDQGLKASVNDFIVKAVAVTLQRVPEVNAMWGKDGQIHLQSNIDVSVAVATDSGLITPIVKNAAHLTVGEISATTRSLAAKARENKLKPEEFQGGTFTVSNLGMYGVVEFTAIINPPQACIMAVGASRLEPCPSGGRPVTVMTVTISSDSRVVDDFTAAKFLETFKQVVESPALTLVTKAESSPPARHTAYQ